MCELSRQARLLKDARSCAASEAAQRFELERERNFGTRCSVPVIMQREASALFELSY
jgi:hypothetical protein